MARASLFFCVFISSSPSGSFSDHFLVSFKRSSFFWGGNIGLCWFGQGFYICVLRKISWFKFLFVMLKCVRFFLILIVQSKQFSEQFSKQT